MSAMLKIEAAERKAMVVEILVVIGLLVYFGVASYTAAWVVQHGNRWAMLILGVVVGAELQRMFSRKGK
jgi:uncharacterized membrane protein YqjE